MKKNTIFIIFCVTSLFFSCKSTKIENLEEKVQSQSIETDEKLSSSHPVSEHKTPVEKVQSLEDLEYARSTANVSVSYEIFNDDKAKILELIAELNVIMNEMDYNGWEKYLDAESINYWSKRSNLQVASSRLPIKNIRLNSLRDYFIHVFLPSHKGYRIDEIRYETDSLIKAVQVAEEENKDIVFYTFYKVDGGFKLHLPQLAD